MRRWPWTLGEMDCCERRRLYTEWPSPHWVKSAMKRVLVLLGLVLLLAGTVASCVNPGAAPTRSPNTPPSPSPTQPTICGNYCNLPTPTPTKGAILGGRTLAEVAADGLAGSLPEPRTRGGSRAVVDA